MAKSMSFIPSWWLRNTHLQTLYPALLRQVSVPTHRVRERLLTPDHDFIDIDWCGTGNGALVILLHGLAGCSRSGYILGLQHHLSKMGLRSAALNFRGCSGEPNLLARGYHSGDTGDLDFLFRTLRQREPEIPIAAVGYSLGGNVLLKWLGEQRGSIDLSAAVAVSVPLVLGVCATKMDQGFSKIYRNHLLFHLKRYIAGKYRYLREQGDQSEADKLSRLGDLSKIRSFWQYDDRVVAKLHGFDGVHHYYRSSSSRQFLKNIVVPSLVIQSLDDPFMTPDVLPATSELSPSVILEVCDRGGHVGFISGRVPFRPQYWLEKRIVEFLHRQGMC